MTDTYLMDLLDDARERGRQAGYEAALWDARMKALDMPWGPERAAVMALLDSMAA